MEGNVRFCVLELGRGRLPPCPEAIARQEESGSLWIAPGSTFLQAIEAMRECMRLPCRSVFSYIEDGQWRMVRNVVLDNVVEAGPIYFFRILVGRRGHEIVSNGACPLHKVFHRFMRLGEISEAFDAFIAKSSTSELCKRMVSGLEHIRMSGGSDMLQKKFEVNYGISVLVGPQPAFQQVSLVRVTLEPGKGTFSSMMPVHQGNVAFLQSSDMLLSDEQPDSLKELGFLWWANRLLKVSLELELKQHLTLVGGGGSVLRVEVMEIFIRSRLTADMVLRVREAGLQEGELILKIGHSADDKQVFEELCIDSTTIVDQAENEARILGKLQAQGCRVCPPLRFCGYWNDKPVVVTRLQGDPLVRVRSPIEVQLLAPFQPKDAEQLCKDLTFTVLELHDYGVIHGDISPVNIGVYSAPRGCRQFYLYDFGFAQELNKSGGKCTGRALSLLFSAGDVLYSGEASLVTELVSIAYVCLHLSGVTLPWQHLAMAGCEDPKLHNHLRRGFAESLAADKVTTCLSSSIQAWITFVLNELPDDADPAAVHRQCQSLLS